MALAGSPATLAFEWPAPDTLLVHLIGEWTIDSPLPSGDDIRTELASMPDVRRLAFDARQLAAWDSALLTFLLQVVAETEHGGVAAYRAGLPEGVRRLLALATAVPARKPRDTTKV